MGYKEQFGGEFGIGTRVEFDAAARMLRVLGKMKVEGRGLRVEMDWNLGFGIIWECLLTMWFTVSPYMWILEFYYLTTRRMDSIFIMQKDSERTM